MDPCGSLGTSSSRSRRFRERVRGPDALSFDASVVEQLEREEVVVRSSASLAGWLAVGGLAALWITELEFITSWSL